MQNIDKLRVTLFSFRYKTKIKPQSAGETLLNIESRGRFSTRIFSIENTRICVLLLIQVAIFAQPMLCITFGDQIYCDTLSFDVFLRCHTLEKRSCYRSQASVLRCVTLIERSDNQLIHDISMITSACSLKETLHLKAVALISRRVFIDLKSTAICTCK